MASATGGWLGWGSREIGGVSPGPAGRWWGSRPGQADRSRSAAQWSDWSRLGAKPVLPQPQGGGDGQVESSPREGPRTG